MKKLKTKLKLWYYFRYSYPKWEKNTTAYERWRNFLHMKALAENDMLPRKRK
mgnify:FL=1